MEGTESALKGKKILAVDDEPDVLESLEELLPMCKLVKASTFEEAKKQLETQSFDIVILDIMGVDGYKLLEIAVDRKIIAVMLTAHALSLPDTVKSFRAGAASYVPKDQMDKMEIFLTDILEARKKGTSFWWRWMGRMEAYYMARFGPAWKEGDKEFWDRFPHHT